MYFEAHLSETTCSNPQSVSTKDTKYYVDGQTLKHVGV